MQRHIQVEIGTYLDDYPDQLFHLVAGECGFPPVVVHQYIPIQLNERPMRDEYSFRVRPVARVGGAASRLPFLPWRPPSAARNLRKHAVICGSERIFINLAAPN